MRARFWISLVALTYAGTALGLEPPPPLIAKSVIVLDERSGKVLYEKDADTKRFPASTTKIMTALLLAENCRPEEIIVAPKDVEKVPPSSLHLKPGEALSARDMLHALMIRSANDAAYAVAVHIGGSVEGFAAMMNDRAKAIGCTKTKFNNPHGLNDDGHVSSARDISLIAREAMKYPEIREAANSRKYLVTRSINQEDLWLVSKNRILKADVTHDGIKTGYTIPAGHCFAGSATRNGFRMITVILASTKDWPDDQKALMNWAFKNFTRTCLEEPGQVVREVKVGDVPVPVSVGIPVFYAHPKSQKPSLRTQLTVKPGIELPISRSAEIGTVTYSDTAGWSFAAPMVAMADVEEKRNLSVASFGSSAPATALIACLLGGGALWMRRKSRIMGS